jgi:hypothetical protein
LPVLGLDDTSSPQPDGDGPRWGDGFEVETLIHARVAKAGLVVVEVPSYEHARLHGASNLNAFRDGRRVVRTILAERHRTLCPSAEEGTGSPIARAADTSSAATL